MIKYIPEDTSVTFSEIPNRVTLCINISNCPYNCLGCHSDYLRQDIGDELTVDILDSLITKNDGINCVCFMGEGKDYKDILNLAKHIKISYPDIEVGVYSGSDTVKDREYFNVFDYIKLGPYIESRGPLNDPNTNQRLYKKIEGAIEEIGGYHVNDWADITYHCRIKTL